jgi:hypothetical protein
MNDLDKGTLPRIGLCPACGESAELGLMTWPPGPYRIHVLVCTRCEAVSPPVSAVDVTGDPWTHVLRCWRTTAMLSAATATNHKHVEQLLERRGELSSEQASQFVKAMRGRDMLRPFLPESIVDRLRLLLSTMVTAGRASAKIAYLWLRSRT